MGKNIYTVNKNQFSLKHMYNGFTSKDIKGGLTIVAIQA